MRPIFKYHGGKWRLATWIISHMPEHKIYIEPFCGAASVLLRKERSFTEVINDLNGRLINVFAVMRDPDKASALREKLRWTPCSRKEYLEARQPSLDDVEDARRAIDVIKQWDNPAALFYVDPPYVACTRQGTGNRGYAHEMTDDQHVELAQLLHEVKGFVMVSGYESELYDNLYNGWIKIKKKAMADRGKHTIECLWLSPDIKPEYKANNNLLF